MTFVLYPHSIKIKKELKMQFVTIPLPLALGILFVLAVSFVWSFRLAKKLDKAYDDYDNLHDSYKHLEYKYHKGI